MATKLHPPQFSELPYEVYFRIEDYAPDQQYITHRHQWGQLNYCATGVMEITVAGQRYLSPPQYALWIPPDTPHDGHIRQPVIYHSAYIATALCRDLPAEPCALVMSPLLKAILADFAERHVMTPATPADKRLAQVLVDQLIIAPHSSNYLPGTQDPVLSNLLTYLQQDLSDNRPLADWAHLLHITERTLARRCQRELGISFGEWRQRQRFLAALPLLEQGQPVHSIALDLGYSTSSAFIAMFRRQSGSTPDQFRRGLR
ncbi:AraC family transcriptional regulator [Janthinobacterium agaricidamnosum]|uniref:Cupin domain protein n=1 Tax=Janthinobacterium agaricidamnosum NBRC 102515 = DSM 9628 TaxID=1349767 RepID=W0V615_9BURK|nr:helix-turn-helix transcriptional regulator [Janthinobacterium agaricidamnosum]CDG84274.1 cupin domain protein [Janthinobacterium agaricidamnosum NBRC 102515 = DSM 9628]